MAEKPFSKSFGFFHPFSTNFLVLYMPRSLTHGDIVFFFSILLPLMKAIYSFYTVDHTL